MDNELLTHAKIRLVLCSSEDSECDQSGSKQSTLEYAAIISSVYIYKIYIFPYMYIMKNNLLNVNL